MKLSSFGQRFAGHSGIVELMEDLGTLPVTHPHIVSMGGGNPADIPAVSSALRQKLVAMIQDPDKSRIVLGRYQSPQGDPGLRQIIANWFRDKYGWSLGPANVAITNGGQSAFFILANMLAGDQVDGSHRHLLFPLVPEYLGYTQAGLSADFFRAARPAISRLDQHLFKYQVDFNSLAVDEQVAGIVVSRPTNPTGNVVTDAELSHLDRMAAERGVPLVIDGAYGLPFPDIVFGEASPYLSDNTVLMLSLSKLGLPGLRSGVLLGPEPLLAAFAAINGIINLASGNIGAWVLAELLESGDMDTLVRDHVNPFYRMRVQQAQAFFHRYLRDDIPWHIHKPEGALFLWLWFENLPVDSRLLYERLKERGVLVIPGNECFPGLQDDWEHTRQCIRVSYALPEDQLEEGISLIAAEINSLYA